MTSSVNRSITSTYRLAIIVAVVAIISTPSARAQDALNFQLYSDVNFVASSEDGSNTAFAIGGVNFFMTSELSDNIRVLSENVLEILDDGVVFDLERIYLEWSSSERLNLRAGRGHIPLGRYMTDYHHATFFQMPVARPDILGFEDEGGLLPAHLIGIEALGKFSFGESAISYNLGVGNGRGLFTDDVLSVADRNQFKAVVARLNFAPTLGGFEIGVSGYLDQIPGGLTDDMGVVLVPESLTEIIGSTHIIYERFPWSMHSEGYYIFHKEENTGAKTQLLGGFLLAGYSVGDYTPYARVDYASRDAADTWFNASGAAVDLLKAHGGVRYDFHEKAALKFEYAYDVEDDVHHGAVQTTFAF